MPNSKLKNLIHLRWYACVGVGILLLCAQWNAAFPFWTPSYYALGVFTASNLILWRLNDKAPLKSDLIVFLITIFDLFYLTLLLIHNGGPHNPFSILFLAISSIAAMNLSRQYLMIIIGVVLCCLGFIYSSGAHHHFEHGDYSLHLQGMWIANSLGVIMISFWISHLRQQNELIAAKHDRAQKILFQLEGLESMGRMLASTAHQLNTPLATMQLGISELSDQSRVLEEIEKTAWLDDMQIALHQISGLIKKIKAVPSDEIEESNQKFDFVAAIETLVTRWTETRNIHVDFQSQVPSASASKTNLMDLNSVIESLLENASDARKDKETLIIQVHLDQDDSWLTIEVKDNGIGMDQKILSRCIEPLYTTKKKGTGLGLYIAHQFATKLGGSLSVDSIAGRGTTVTLKFLKDKLA